MKSLFALIIASVILVSNSNADLILETGTGAFDSTSCCGTLVYENQFLGTTFSLSEKTNIDGIGGHFINVSSSFGSIFGAIVSLNEMGLPDGSMSSLDNVLAYTTFNPLSSVDTLVSIDLDLDAGLYGLVFGSGLFGADGSSALTLLQPYHGYNPDGDIISLGGSNPNWRDSDTNPGRFRMFVSGTPIEVSEPNGLALFLIPFALILRRRFKNV